MVSTELVDNQVMDKIFVGKVNVMPLESINQKIGEFRTLSGDELKQAIIAFANQTIHIE
ncbi:nucleoside-diphosphate sugar isomerase [Streptococcus pneumoniae]|nr:nucleoside-diphosphate sugar isomerase [Streptococcus pneumoniae]